MIGFLNITDERVLPPVTHETHTLCHRLLLQANAAKPRHRRNDTISLSHTSSVYSSADNIANCRCPCAHSGEWRQV